MKAAQARLSLRLSKYHIVGNHMSRLISKNGDADCDETVHAGHYFQCQYHQPGTF